MIGDKSRAAILITVTLAVAIYFWAAFANALPPEGLIEVIVQEPDEVSGVAATHGGFLVVGDGEPRHMFEAPNHERHKIEFGNEKGNICDPESIDVGFKPDGTAVRFILGEDAKTIFVENGIPIVLPPEFYERCNRGAEGISVRWSNGGWDLVALSEGGIPNKKHTPNPDKTRDCKKISKSACPIETAIYNPVLAYYRISEDGKKAELKSMSFLRTSQLLEGVDQGQGFRASDLTWFEDDILVLLNSSPISRKKKDGFRHTWIKAFKIDGTPIAMMTFKLEEQWGDYWKGKKWEGLDAMRDGRSLVLAYDSGTTPSELVIFRPDFGVD